MYSVVQDRDARSLNEWAGYFYRTLTRYIWLCQEEEEEKEGDVS